MPILLLAATLALSAQAHQPGPDTSSGPDLPETSANLDFVMLNRTGQTIVELNISPQGDESWSDNLLHYPAVEDQERAAASFTRDIESCRWDIRVRFQSGGRRSWPAVNLCDTVRVELR